MSMQERYLLVNHPNLKFSSQAPDARADLLNDDPATGTSSYMIEQLTYLCIEKGWPIELTMVRTGHGNDGPRGHYGGFAWDGWLLKVAQQDDWEDATAPRFAAFLTCLDGAPARYQIGLGGSAKTTANFAAAGRTAFDDNDEDHIHGGCTDGTF